MNPCARAGGARLRVAMELVLSKSRRPLALLGAAMVTLQFAGCANRIYLYDEVRDKQAAAAKTASDAVKSSDFIAAEQKNLDALLAEELATQDKLARAVRDLRIRSIVGSPLVAKTPKVPAASLGDLIDGSLSALLGSAWGVPGGPGHAKELDNTMAQWEAWKEGQRRVANALSLASDPYDIFGIGVPSCESAKPPKAGAVKATFDAASFSRQAEIQAVLDNLSNVCAAAPAMPQYTGLVSGAYADLATAQKAEKAAEDAVAAPKKAYQTALDTYNKAVANIANLAAPDAQVAVDKAAADLTKAIGALDHLNSALSTQFIAQQRLDSLQDFVTAVTTGVYPVAATPAPAADAKPAAADASKSETPPSKAAAAVVLLTNLADNARKSLADAKTPLNLPLQIQRDQLQLQLQAANVDVDAQKRAVTLYGQLAETLANEVHELGLARNELWRVTPDKAASHNVNMPLLQDAADYGDAFQKANVSEKKLLLSATRRYLDVVYSYDAQRYKLNYQLIAATYDRTLAYSAVSVKRWQSLVDASTGQVAEFYAGGIKPATLIAVLQAFGVVWIGHGVNK